jgi:hypothetical protein
LAAVFFATVDVTSGFTDDAAPALAEARFAGVFFLTEADLDEVATEDEHRKQSYAAASQGRVRKRAIIRARFDAGKERNRAGSRENIDRSVETLLPH